MIWRFRSCFQELLWRCRQQGPIPKLGKLEPSQQSGFGCGVEDNLSQSVRVGCIGSTGCLGLDGYWTERRWHLDLIHDLGWGIGIDPGPLGLVG